MKASEIRDLNMEEMHRKLTDLKQELFNLRFQHETGQLENSQKMKQTKRDIARVKTVIKQSELNTKTG
ncbi:MAG TPA: 50S ribosomal protein L29 [Desulfobacterales bacterium]|jgi:large subunit ribosomal protein L29|nr:50S ribosomal protein L29 [Desulfobacterales bacterium]